MKEVQVLAVLKEAEVGAKISDVCKKHSISEATFYRWRTIYANVDRSNLTEIRSLQTENAQLKRMYVELALQNNALNDTLWTMRNRSLSEH